MATKSIWENSDKVNRQYMPSFKIIKNHYNQSSLVIQNSVAPDDTLINILKDGSIKARDRYTIEIKAGHIYHPVAKYINHSCQPNAYVDIDTGCINSLYYLTKGTHITIDYHITESNILESFDCACGSPNCKGHIS